MDINGISESSRFVIRIKDVLLELKKILTGLKIDKDLEMVKKLYSQKKMSLKFLIHGKEIKISPRKWDTDIKKKIRRKESVEDIAH